MALSIRNEKAERLAREVAHESGETITQAIIQALEDRLERLRGRRMATDVEADIMRISRRCSSLPDRDPGSPDAVLGYDDDGVPA